MLAGALWGFLPGYLKAKFNVNEIITTLMLNYVAVNWNNFFIFAVWTEGGFQMSPKFPQTAWLPRLTDYAAQNPQLRGLTLHLGLLFAIIAACVMWWVIYRSRWGYEVRLTGDNPRAARYAGINICPHHDPRTDGLGRAGRPGRRSPRSPAWYIDCRAPSPRGTASRPSSSPGWRSSILWRSSRSRSFLAL